MTKLHFITGCSGTKNPRRCISGKKKSSRALRKSNRLVKKFGISRRSALKKAWGKVHARRLRRHGRK